MGEEQPPGGGRMFKKAMEDAKRDEKLRRAARSRSGVAYPRLLSAAIRQAAAVRVRHRAAVLNLRRHHGGVVHIANASGAKKEAGDDPARNANGRALPTANASSAKKEAGDDPARNANGRALPATNASAVKKEAGDDPAKKANGRSLPAGNASGAKKDAGDDPAKNAYTQAAASIPDPEAGVDSCKNHGSALLAASSAEKETGDNPGKSHTIVPATAMPRPFQEPPQCPGDDDEASNMAKNMACVEELMQSLSKELGLALPQELGLALARTPPCSPLQPPPPPIELRQATPPPPTYPPPPLLRTWTVRNQQEALDAFQAWKNRGPDALLVHVPADVTLIQLEMIWEVLHEASLNIFEDPVSIWNRLWLGR